MMGRRRAPVPEAPDGAARKALEDLLVEVLPGIRREARIFGCKVRGAVAADDLAQAGAEAAWRALLRPGSSDRAAVKGFCLWKAGRVMIDAFQAEHVHERHRGEQPEYLEPTDESETSQVAERQELLARVCGQIDKLPAREREIIHRLYVADDSSRTAAAAMGLAQSRIVALHQQVIEKVRAAMGIAASASTG